jgi:RNA-directed DNA polymerase
MGLFSKLFGGKGPEPGLVLEELARRLKMSPEELSQVAPNYRELKLPKKSGGTRTIHAPDDNLKNLQRTILRRVLGGLSAHPAAMGFERGQSIATNAAVHVGKAVILKMDLRDFFMRTTAKRVRAYFVKIGWGGEAADALVRLTTHRGGLPQGAPTSPRLSNLVNYGLDARLFALGMKVGATYTRYADDMTFSIPDDHRMTVAQLILVTRDAVKEYGYQLHTDKKLRILRRHDRMTVTGLVCNQTLNLPREMRRKLRAVQHHLEKGKKATLTEVQLKGWRSLEQMVAAQRRIPPATAQPD